MKRNFDFYPEGTCCKLMRFTLDGDLIDHVEFFGGCHGNLQGIASLVKGMPYQEVIHKLQGIKCGNKMTSCPDQFSQALKKVESGEL